MKARTAALATLRSLAEFTVAPKRLLAGLEPPLVDLLLQAADIADAIFWRQVLPDEVRSKLLAHAGDDQGIQELLRFHYGPYDHLNDDEPFVAAAPKPAGGAFYPPDLSADEFAKHLEEHPENRAAFESPFTVVRRAGGGLLALPYHEAYREDVARLARRLRAASAVAHHSSFARYLSQRAADIETDEYSTSDSLWVRLSDNPIDLVVGPYEVYEDGLMGLKAAYQAILVLRDQEESANVRHYEREVTLLCRELASAIDAPLPVEESRVALSVARLVYTGGYARKGTPAIGFTLPNDAQTVEEVGARQVILKNVLETKFTASVWPIAQRIIKLAPDDEMRSSRHFVTQTIFHEISHSIGPRQLHLPGGDTTVNRALRQYYSPIEEAKADVLASCMLTLMLEGRERESFLRTYVAGLLRPIRFGLASAHGGANSIQFNFLLERDAIRIDERSGTLIVDDRRVTDALQILLSRIITIQRSGDLAEARKLVGTYRTLTGPLKQLLSSIAAIPIDICVRYLLQ
jgi:hypothetical protein